MFSRSVLCLSFVLSVFLSSGVFAGEVHNYITSGDSNGLMTFLSQCSREEAKRLVNEPTDGIPPIFAAVDTGNGNLVAVLAENGADLFCTYRQQTVIQRAQQLGMRKVAELIWGFICAPLQFDMEY